MRYYDIQTFGNYSWKWGDDKDTLAQDAFRSLLLIRVDSIVDRMPSIKLKETWKNESAEWFRFKLTDGNTVCI